MPEVTVFTRTTCGPCRTVKYYLEKQGIPFLEKNVDADPSLMNEIIERTGFMQVPTIKINEYFVSGANLPLISKLLMV
jgi:glutaredoxin 3